MRSRFVPRFALANWVKCTGLGRRSCPSGKIQWRDRFPRQPRAAEAERFPQRRSCVMPRDRSASYSRCAARPSQNAAPIIRTAATAGHAETAGGGGDQPVGFRCRWIVSKPSVSSKFRNIFHAPDRWTGPMSRPGAMQIRHPTPGHKASFLAPAIEFLMIGYICCIIIHNSDTSLPDEGRASQGF